jgi:subtilisin-like proprotein convertase family protein
LALAGYSLSLGNGNTTIDPNECDYLNVVLTDPATPAVTNISATLSSLTPNVAVTQPYSTYPNLSAGGPTTAANTTPFQISTTTNFICGTNITLMLTVATSSHGTFSFPLVLPSGTPGSPSRYDNNSVTNIPDVGTIESTNVVSGFTDPLDKVVVSLWLTHPVDSDLTLTLISPDGTPVTLVSATGSGANFGSACSPDASRTIFDDAAATSITNGSPPFVGTFRPQGSLASFINGTANGNWRLRVTDGFGGSIGALRCWSLFLYRPTCTPGSGVCELCPNAVISSATGPSSAMQGNNVNPNGIPSVCGVPKACPGVNLGGPFPSDNYIFRNGPTDACVTVTLEDDSSVLMIATVYSGSYDISNPDKCVNYLADGGNILSPANPIQAFSFNVSSNATFVVNVLASSPTPTAPYKLTVSGGDCRPVLKITPVSTNNVQLDWTTAAPGYNLEQTNQMAPGSGNWPQVMDVPVIVNSRFRVTNNAAIGSQFFRLHKP